jgi:hypothetical protein
MPDELVSQNNGDSEGNGKRGGIANLRPFTKGKSGNPGGRPKAILSQAYRECLKDKPPPEVAEAMRKKYGKAPRTIAEMMAQFMVNHAIKGNVPAAVELRKATEGETVNIQGDDDHPVNIIVVRDALAGDHN